MIDVVCIDSSIHAVKNGGLRDKKRRSRVDSDSQQAVADRDCDIDACIAACCMSAVWCCALSIKRLFSVTLQY